MRIIVVALSRRLNLVTGNLVNGDSKEDSRWFFQRLRERPPSRSQISEEFYLALFVRFNCVSFGHLARP